MVGSLNYGSLKTFECILKKKENKYAHTKHHLANVGNFFFKRPLETDREWGVLTKCYPWLQNSPGAFINIDIGVVGLSWIYNQPEGWFPFDN